MKAKPLGNLQLHTAKQQLKGQLAMSEENYSAMMLMMAKSTLDLNKITSLDEIFQKIERITSEELLDISNKVLNKEDMSVLNYLPE